MEGFDVTESLAFLLRPGGHPHETKGLLPPPFPSPFPPPPIPFIGRPCPGLSVWSLLKLCSVLGGDAMIQHEPPPTPRGSSRICLWGVVRFLCLVPGFVALSHVGGSHRAYPSPACLMLMSVVKSPRSGCSTVDLSRRQLCSRHSALAPDVHVQHGQLQENGCRFILPFICGLLKAWLLCRTVVMVRTLALHVSRRQLCRG